MDDSDRATHNDLFGEAIDAPGERVSDGSLVYDESDLPLLATESDDRGKTVLVNRDIVPDAGDLLVAVVEYGHGVGVAEHYHEGTKRFFCILEGEGVLEVDGEQIEGETTPLTEGAVALADPRDRPLPNAREEQRMRDPGCFSNKNHEITFFGDRYT